MRVFANTGTIDARLLVKFSLREVLQADEGVVIQCTVHDRVICLLLDSGTCLLLHVDTAAGSEQHIPEIHMYARIRLGDISACTIYTDASNLFSKKAPSNVRKRAQRRTSRRSLAIRTNSHSNLTAGGKRSGAPLTSAAMIQTPRKARMSYGATEIDDLYGEEADLYGSGAVIVEEPEVEQVEEDDDDVEMNDMPPQASGTDTPAQQIELDIWRDENKCVDDDVPGQKYYLSLVRGNGDLEVLKLG